MDNKRRVAVDGPPARKRRKDHSHAAAAVSPALHLGGPLRGGAGAKGMDELMVEDAVYRQMLPVVKRELECKRDADMALVRRGVKRTEKEAMVCAACRTPRTFKGFEALLIHAERFVKENARQHRGYFRALKEALQDDEDSAKKSRHRTSKDVDFETAAPAFPPPRHFEGEVGKVGCWKPNILLVRDEKLDEVERIICPWPSHRESADGRHACVTTPDRTQGAPRLKEILAVYSSGKDDKCNVFVFPATEVGYIDGKELTLARQKDHHQVAEYRFSDNQRNDLDLRSSHDSEANTLAGSDFNMAGKWWRNMKEKHGLKLLPESEVYKRRGQLFEDGRLDRMKKIMTRWSTNFSALNRNSEAQRPFRDGGRNLYEVGRVWQDDLRRIESYTPATKKKVRNQILAIESELKKKQLVWLHEVEGVREQFQRMADSIKKEEEATNWRKFRWAERNMKKQQKLEHEQMRLENLRRIERVKSELRSKRFQRDKEGQVLVETWIDEYQRLYQESCKAKDERLRLQAIHDKVHNKAYLTKKRECPICLKTLFGKVDLIPVNTKGDGVFKQFLPVNRLCLDRKCPQRHKT